MHQSSDQTSGIVTGLISRDTPEQRESSKNVTGIDKNQQITLETDQTFNELEKTQTTAGEIKKLLDQIDAAETSIDRKLFNEKQDDKKLQAPIKSKTFSMDKKDAEEAQTARVRFIRRSYGSGMLKLVGQTDPQHALSGRIVRPQKKAVMMKTKSNRQLDKNKSIVSGEFNFSKIMKAAGVSGISTELVSVARQPINPDRMQVVSADSYLKESTCEENSEEHNVSLLPSLPDNNPIFAKVERRTVPRKYSGHWMSLPQIKSQKNLKKEVDPTVNQDTSDNVHRLQGQQKNMRYRNETKRQPVVRHQSQVSFTTMKIKPEDV